MERRYNSSGRFAVLFLVIPTIFIVLGLVFFTYPLSEEIEAFLLIPLFGSLILLGAGFFIKKEGIAEKIKIIGWILFAFYWSTRTDSLYFGEDGDIVNAFLCIAGIYVLFYIAYHEWLSLNKEKKVECLNWAAGAAAIAGLIYFGIEKTPLALWLIETVAFQSGQLLNLFTGNVTINGTSIIYNGSSAVSIIFACTAVQSMVLFVGMILPLAKVGAKRKLYGLFLTIVPIYFLNLIRNALVTYLIGTNTTDFNVAHNIIGKGGSLIALIILLLIVVKVLPELFDEIMCLINLPKRNGPIERCFKKYFGGEKNA